FEAQMKWLSDRGYTCPTMSELDKYTSKEKIVFITFDDGYYDNFKTVLPILKKYNHKATFYISTNYINDKTRFKSSKGHMLYENLEMMNVDDLNILLNEGMEVGSHTKSHQMISRINKEEQILELTESIN